MSSWDMKQDFRFLTEEARKLQVDSVAELGEQLLKLNKISMLKKKLDKMVILLRKHL